MTFSLLQCVPKVIDRWFLKQVGRNLEQRGVYIQFFSFLVCNTFTLYKKIYNTNSPPHQSPAAQFHAPLKINHSFLLLCFARGNKNIDVYLPPVQQTKANVLQALFVTLPFLLFVLFIVAYIVTHCMDALCVCPLLITLGWLLNESLSLFVKFSLIPCLQFVHWDDQQQQH